MKKQIKKLNLNKEVITQLNSQELHLINGGQEERVSRLCIKPQSRGNDCLCVIGE